MNWKVFIGAFLTIFLAELGDKTQLAVITMSSGAGSKWSVFWGACLALITITFIGVLVGDLVSRYIPTGWLHKIVAVAFILIGILMLTGKL